jgi:hypothetical protein
VAKAAKHESKAVIEAIAKALHGVHDLDSFLALLRDPKGLNWPIPAEAPEEIVFTEWKASELKTRGLSPDKVKHTIRQIGPFNRGEPFSVFVVNFNKPDAMQPGRGLTGVLRAFLRALVAAAKNEVVAQDWQRHRLLFICTHDWHDYRFAYFTEPPEGRGEPPLRIFGFNFQQPSRTAWEHNLPYLAWPEQKDRTEQAWLARIADAFAVEKVTENFFHDYRTVFDAFINEIDESVFDGAEAGRSASDSRRLYVQALFNRLLFLRFIERKGWLVPPGVPPRSNAATPNAAQTREESLIPHDYLQSLFTDYNTSPKRGSFYSERLAPLFFQALAVEGYSDPKTLGSTPFLNGGLFERNELDKRVDAADLPDKSFRGLFDALMGASGLFYRYNFTVEESTPIDVDVAVDPEMLGKVFEELVTGRHESGSYYTPRNVVSFMCREALKGYLENAANLSATEAALFVDTDQPHTLDDLQIEAVRLALKDVRAVDPACGSGAYLLGLMNELLRLLARLNPEGTRRRLNFRYDNKLQMISNNLYGVDIDPFATGIARLRLWLSLAVEANDALPLPNLDTKIETGDSLLGPDPRTRSTFENREEVSALSTAYTKLRDRYQNEHSQQKHKLFVELKASRERIAVAKGATLRAGIVDYRIDFSEVFDRPDGGFDIVLANPPYVRQESVKHLKPALKEEYRDFFSGTADLFTYFYWRAVQLLRPGGMLSFISSNKWFRAAYGANLRRALSGSCSIRSITDFQDLPVFEGASAYPMIFIAQKLPVGADRRPPLPTRFSEPPSLDPPYPDVLACVNTFGYDLPASVFSADEWVLASAEARARIETMRTAGTPLNQHLACPIYRGITTGFNTAFILDEEARARLIREDKRSAEIIKPLARGRDIRRWQLREAGEFLIVTKVGVDMKRYPAVMKHLKQWEKELRVRDDQGNHWWELRACAYYAAFEKPKILSQKVSERPSFAFDAANHTTLNTSYFLIPKQEPLYLAGLLNSAVFEDYARRSFVGKEGGFYEVQPVVLGEFPIPPASHADRAAVANLAQACINAKAKDPEANVSHLEAQINTIVTRLYGLS